MGMTSRRKAERLIAEGLVTVDGAVASLGLKVLPGDHDIRIDDKVLDHQRGMAPKVYWLLNKPDFTLVSHSKDQGKERIYDLPSLKKVPFSLSAVGRLDYRTQGLLFLSNDGPLIHRLTHPNYKIPRHYHALVSGKLTWEEIKKIRNGLKLKDGVVNQVDIEYLRGENLGHSSGSWYLVTVREGRNRLVRRLFEALDYKVVTLVRIGFGDICLPPALKPGHYQQLTAKEIRYLKRSVQL